MFWRKSAPAPDAKSSSGSSSSATPAKAPENFPPRNETERAALLQFIAEAPIAHGPWQKWKQTFKAIEAQPQADTAALSAMLSRVDALPLGLPRLRGNVWNEVPPGAPVARWDAAQRGIVTRDALGNEGSMAFSGYGQMVQLGTIVVAVAGDYNDAHLHFVDVSDAAQPLLLSAHKMDRMSPYNAFAFAARKDDYLILCLRVSTPYNNVRLVVFDVSQPTTPRLVGSLVLGVAYNFQAAFDGTRLFFIGGDWNRTQIKVVDLSTITKPKLGGGVEARDTGWGSNLLAAHDGFVYRANTSGRSSLRIIDGRDADKPREVSHLQIEALTGVTVKEGRVYVRVDPRGRKNDTEKSRFRLVDISNPAKPQLLGAPPSSRTIGYIKRRARRLLWKLAQQNAALYVDLARRLIEANGTVLNYEERWLSVDAILGTGQRFQQRRHGRAGYQLKQPRFVLKRREERFPEVWDAHPDAARKLWQSEFAPVEAREMALKILRANKQDVPAPETTRLEEFLRGTSALLQSYAVRALWQYAQVGGTLGGKTAAVLLLAAPGQLRAAIETWAGNAKWNKEERRAFGTQLRIAVNATRPDGKDVPWRRRDYAAKLLADAWSEFLDENALLENLPFWLRLSDATLDARLLQVLRAAGAAQGNLLPGHLRTLTRQLPKIAEEQRERLLNAFLGGASGRAFKGEEALALVNQDDIAALGWRILTEAKMTPNGYAELWNPLFRGQASPSALAMAFSDAALRVFENAQVGNFKDSLRPWVETNVHVFQHASPAFFDALMNALPDKDRPRVVFRALAFLPEPTATSVWEKYGSLAGNFKAGRNDFQRANFYNYGQEPGARAWDYLAGSRITAEELRELWSNLMRMAQWSQQTGAFTNAAAPGLLRRAEFPPEEFAELIKQFPIVLERASPLFYLAILDNLPAEQRLQRLIETTPERWQAARGALLESLNQPSALNAFWTAIWEQLKGDDTGLQNRLLNDEAIVSTFERLEAPAFEGFLKTDSPAHEAWIMRWLRTHKPEKGDEILLLAATHNLPEVRRWALGRAEYLRLDLATALRLLEAELPDCVAAGRKFFEALPTGGSDEMDYALALCDSPGYAARGFGREFIEARRATLFSGDLLARLAQHSSPDMQAWLAEKLLDNEAPAEATKPFDRAVLRARGRARKAKDLVQTRQEQTGLGEAAPDSATLLEIARGRTKRDADWALRQLAGRALSGEKIEGVEIVTEVSQAAASA